MRKIIMMLALLVGLLSFGQQKRAHTDSGLLTRTEAKKTLARQVQDFIRENNSKYRLTDQKSREIIKLTASGEPHLKVSDDRIKKVLQKVKERELQKLFFKENPNQRALFTEMSRPANVTQRDACDNGDFEDGITDDYDFFTLDYYLNGDVIRDIDCAFNPTDPLLPMFYPLLPADYSTNVTLTYTDTTTPVYDSVLANHGIYEPVADIPSGATSSQAIRLNDEAMPMLSINQGIRMVKTFTAEGPSVSYSFLLVCENPIDHDPTHQPRFVVTLYDHNGNVVGRNCIVSDVTSNLFYNAVEPGLTPLLYTGWQRASLSTNGIENAANIADREVTLEFSVYGCTQGAHFGYAYIDNICNEQIDGPFGEAKIDLASQTQGNCPAFPLTVSGTYSLPYTVTGSATTGTLNSLSLSIYDAANNLVNTLTSPTLTTTVTPMTFSFTLNEADFNDYPIGAYHYEINADFLLNGVHFPKTAFSTNPAVTFNDCIGCPDHLPIATAVPTNTASHKQAHIDISASNVINTTSSSSVNTVYRAGTEVLMTDGFTALKNSVFRAHIEDCTTAQYVARTTAPQKASFSDYMDSIALEKISSVDLLSVYPNPAHHNFTIALENVYLQKVTITSIDGKIVFEQSYGRKESQTEIDISNLSNGIYILNVVTADGGILTKKLLKN